jgi:hypothetical protein
MDKTPLECAEMSIEYLNGIESWKLKVES